MKRKEYQQKNPSPPTLQNCCYYCGEMKPLVDHHCHECAIKLWKDCQSTFSNPPPVPEPAPKPQSLIATMEMIAAHPSGMDSAEEMRAIAKQAVKDYTPKGTKSDE